MKRIFYGVIAFLSIAPDCYFLDLIFEFNFGASFLDSFLSLIWV
jgi:hypothetical protein